MSTSTRQRRVKGEGSLRKKGKKYYLEFKINGKRKSLSLGTGNKKEAEIEARKYFDIPASKTSDELAVFVQKARDFECFEEIPITDIWDRFFNDPARPDSSKGTLKNYKSNLKRFIHWLHKEKPRITTLNNVDCKIAKEYANELYKSGIAAKTFNDHIKALMLIYRIVMHNSGFTKNPFDKNNIFRKNEYKQGREKLYRDQIKLVLEKFNAPEFHLMHKEENKILFYIGAYTGLRLIDCVYLEWNNIDFNSNLIRCIPRKTERIQRNVVIPILPQLKEQLQTAKSWKINSYILPKIANRYDYNPYGVKKDNIKVFKECGLATTYETKNGKQRQRKANRFGFHSFRHSFATILAEEGVDVVKLSKILGDDCTTLNRYYININDNLIKNININY